MIPTPVIKTLADTIISDKTNYPDPDEKKMIRDGDDLNYLFLLSRMQSAIDLTE